ncbi:MAG: SDR family NAD(P)-dependent oxidoreductase [Verrucomicrobiota bacterium]
MKKILITGGAGFIGFHLLKRLRQEDAEIVLCDNLSRGVVDAELNEILESPNVSLIEADLTKKEEVEKLGTGFDEVFHLAAILGVENVLRHPDEVMRVNVTATMNILDWCSNGGGKKLFFSSTSEAYAWTKLFHEIPVPTPETVPLSLTDLKNPRASYAGSKVFGELATCQYGEMRDMEYVIVRYHNVYGPRMGLDHVIPQLHQRLIQGERPLKVRSTHHMRAFCYVDDAVDLSLNIMRQSAASGEIFNIGNDTEEISIGDLASKIIKLSELEAEMDSVEAENDPIQRRCPDMSKARKILDYAPRFSLDEGLQETIAWYTRFYN